MKAARKRAKAIDELKERLMAKPGKKTSLEDHDPGWTGGVDKRRATELLRFGVEKLAEQQDKLYAQNTYALLIIFTHTSTKWAPWYIVPADNKWFMRLAVAPIVHRTLEDLELVYPEVSTAHRQELLEARRILMEEKG